MDKANGRKRRNPQPLTLNPSRKNSCCRAQTERRFVLGNGVAVA